MRTLALPAILILTLILCECSPADRDPLEVFLSDYISRHPASETQDIYKLLYQAHFGPGHAISDIPSALDDLLEEAADLDEGPAEPLTEPCGPDGSLLRVNLRPYQRRGYSLDSLAAAMVRSAASIRPDTAAFLHAWEQVVLMAKNGSLPLSVDSVTDFTDRVRKLGYPAVHHSRRYSMRMAPAYRVILNSEFLRITREH